MLPWIAFNLHEYRWLWPIARDAVGRRPDRRAQLEARRAPAAGGRRRVLGPLAAALAAARRGHPGRLAPVGGDRARDRRRADRRRCAPASSCASACASATGERSCSCRSRASTSCSPRTPPRSAARPTSSLATSSPSRAAYAALRRHGRRRRSATGRPWVARGCACGLALLLVWQMLDLAYPGWSGERDRRSATRSRSPTSRPSCRLPGSARNALALPLETYLGRGAARARDRRSSSGSACDWRSTRRTTGPTTRRTRSRSPSRSPSTARRPCSARTRSRSIRGARCRRGRWRSGGSSRRPAPTRRSSPDGRYAQLLALERPYAYYLAAPVSWVVPWYHRLLALRLLCVALMCLSVGFLWAAVREAWPANPLAAGRGGDRARRR